MRFAIAAVVSILLAAPGWAQREEVDREVFVRGRVLDNLSKPVAAKLLLRNKDSGEITTTVTGKNGAFSVEHPICSGVMLDVVAPEKTRLTRAQYPALNGHETKNMVIRLHPGFLITGRVVSHGKGLRDLDVVAMPDANSNADELIHGGGLSRTARDGTFKLVLTPGHKLLKVVNNTYSVLPKMTERKIVVTADGVISEIVLK